MVRKTAETSNWEPILQVLSLFGAPRYVTSLQFELKHELLTKLPAEVDRCSSHTFIADQSKIFTSLASHKTPLFFENPETFQASGEKDPEKKKTLPNHSNKKVLPS